MINHILKVKQNIEIIKINEKVIKSNTPFLYKKNVYNSQGIHINFPDKYIEFCTMKYGAPVCNIIRYCPFRRRLETKPPKLIELYKELFNEIPKNLHNSLIDVFVCFRCFYKLLTSKDIFEENVSLSEEFYSLT